MRPVRTEALAISRPAPILCALAALLAPALARATDPKIATRVERFNELVGEGGEDLEPARTEEAARILAFLLETFAHAPKDSLYKLRFSDAHRLAERTRREGKWDERWERFYAALKGLDLAQYRRNRFAERATTKWVLRFAEKAEVDHDAVEEGWIDRDEGEVCLRPDGTTDEDETDRDDVECEDAPYAVYSMRIPHVPPLRVHKLGDISDRYLNSNTVEEFEAPLISEPKAVSRIHRTIDFMLSTGYMELYRVYERMDPDFVLYREENARTGSYVRSSDGALRIVPDGRGGSYYTLLLTADTVYEPSFVAEKRVGETVKALAIFRQYVRLRNDEKGPGELVRAAVAAGEREFEERQRGSADNFFLSLFEDL